MIPPTPAAFEFLAIATLILKFCEKFNSKCAQNKSWTENAKFATTAAARTTPDDGTKINYWQTENLAFVFAPAQRLYAIFTDFATDNNCMERRDARV